ncbi:MAG: hypothetical protein R3D26_07835 [Cyanobacteriota/Melainabacteria group bacterium]
MKASDLLNTEIFGAAVTMEGLINNIDVALQYIDFWLRRMAPPPSTTSWKMPPPQRSQGFKYGVVAPWCHPGGRHHRHRGALSGHQTDLLKKLNAILKIVLTKPPRFDALVRRKELTEFLYCSRLPVSAGRQIKNTNTLIQNKAKTKTKPKI